MENQILEGKLSGTNKGYGFVSIQGYDEDFFIPAKFINGALDGDTVQIELDKRGGTNTAKIVAIKAYANQTIIGNMMYGLLGNYVVSDNPRIGKVVLIDPRDLNRATVGDKVVVKVTAQPNGDENLRGEVDEVLGKASERSVLEKAIVRANHIRDTFPPEVLTASDNIPQDVPEEAKKGRLDLRKETIFTIDGDDTRDIDDAVSIEKLPNGNYKLGVHIADVGNYVPRNSEIDKEAYQRGTSSYFPGYVIPMLPTSLSNGICSLNEGVDRLALSCIMEINPEGKIVDHLITESVINSNARCTYNKVLATLQDKETEEKYQKIKPQLKLMEELTHILEKKREDAGYLELDLPEAYFILNEKGELIDIEKREITIANRLIEAFMIAANETVAEHYYNEKVPFVYRVHEVPAPEKTQALLQFMEGLGLNPIAFPEIVTPKHYQTILKSIDNEPYEQVLNKVLLRSLQKARYCDQCLGHFGLASQYYTHFTSPIRRYSDLTIHRIIKDSIHNKIKDKNELEEFVQDASATASETEKRAEVAERQVNALKMAEYMQKHIGEDFEGKISSVTPFGVFVELENTIEGLVRIENMPEPCEYIEDRMCLKGAKNIYNIGDPIKVKCVAIDLPRRQIDFCEASTVYVPKQDKSPKAKIDRNDNFRPFGNQGNGGHKNGYSNNRKPGNNSRRQAQPYNRQKQDWKNQSEQDDQGNSNDRNNGNRNRNNNNNRNNSKKKDKYNKKKHLEGRKQRNPKMQPLAKPKHKNQEEESVYSM